MLVVALVPRLWGIGWQLPAALYFDELKYVEWAGAMAAGRGAETDFRNPSLYRHLLHAEYRVGALLTRPSDARTTAVAQLRLARLTSAVLGALAVVLTALATARLAALALVAPTEGQPRGRCAPSQQTEGGGTPSGRLAIGGESSGQPGGGDSLNGQSGGGDATGGLPVVAGATAGLLLGWSLLHVHMSHYAVNDATASCFLAGGLLFGVRALASPSGRVFLLAGLWAGLAATAKYNYGVVVALPLTAALAMGVRAALARPASRLAGPARWLLLTLLGAAIGVAIGMPEALTTPSAILAGVADQARVGASRWNGQSEEPVWLLYGQALERGIGVPTLGLALAGALVLGRRRPVVLGAVLAAPLLYLAVMLRSELFFARFAIPPLPFLAGLAGLGVGWLARLPLRPLVRGVLVAGALGTAVVPQAAAVVHHDRLATTPDTRVLAQEWLAAHVSGVLVVSEVYGVPLPWAGYPRLSYRLHIVGRLSDLATVRRLACDGARYMLVASLTAERALARSGGTSAGYAEVVRLGRLAARFDPFPPGKAAPAHPDDTGIPFWHLGAYERPGPRIEVYELPDGGRALCEAGEAPSIQG